MQTTDPTAYIIAAGVLGATLGFLAAGLLASRRFQRLEKQTWDSARIFYTRLFADHENRPRL